MHIFLSFTDRAVDKQQAEDYNFFMPEKVGTCFILSFQFMYSISPAIIEEVIHGRF